MDKESERELLELAVKAGLLPDNSHPTPETRHMRQKMEALKRFAALISAEIGKTLPGAYTDLEGTIPAKPGDPVALLRPLGENDLAAMMRKGGKT